MQENNGNAKPQPNAFVKQDRDVIQYLNTERIRGNPLFWHFATNIRVLIRPRTPWRKF